MSVTTARPGRPCSRSSWSIQPVISLSRRCFMAIIVGTAALDCREYLVLNRLGSDTGWPGDPGKVGRRQREAARRRGQCPPLRGGNLLAEGGWEEVHGAIVNDPAADCVSSRYLIFRVGVRTYPAGVPTRGPARRRT